MVNEQTTQHFLGISQKQWIDAISAACASFIIGLLGDARVITKPSPPPKDEVAEAAALLGVPRNAKWKEVRRAFRAKMLAHHPDRGGDPELTQRLIAAKKLLLAKQLKVVA